MRNQLPLAYEVRYYPSTDLPTYNYRSIETSLNIKVKKRSIIREMKELVYARSASNRERRRSD
jgi:hypothetical protein